MVVSRDVVVGCDDDIVVSVRITSRLSDAPGAVLILTSSTV